MKRQLAIITYEIGATPETFIRRHIEYMYPDRTVVLTHKINPPEESTWDVDCPVYLINKPQDIFSKGIRFIRSKLGFNNTAKVDVIGIKEFLKEHEVELLWGHYINIS